MHAAAVGSNAAGGPSDVLESCIAIKFSPTLSSSGPPAVSSGGSDYLSVIRAKWVSAPLRSGDASSTGDVDAPPTSGTVGPSGV